MALVDKVISILTIPDKNTNDSIDGNSTDAYDAWAKGDGQYLLPLILIFIVIFCVICAILQVFIFLIILCVRHLIGADDDEDEIKEKDESKRDSSISIKQEKSLRDGSQAESTDGTPGDGTPRSRKSTITSPDKALSV